ncbi:MAG: hypothetical protein AAFZ07_06540 [Actinomycetota bacterium]
MSTEQIAVRMPAELLAALDDLIAAGRFESRAAAVRAGAETVVRLEHERDLDRAVVDGYRRRPPDAGEEAASIASLRDAILDEPW